MDKLTDTGAVRILREEIDRVNKPPEPPDIPATELPVRVPISNGTWIITCQLEVGDTPHGDPLVLHFTDASIAGSKPSSDRRKGGGKGMPEDVGFLVSRAIHERAEQLRSTAGKKRREAS